MPSTRTLIASAALGAAALSTSLLAPAHAHNTPAQITPAQITPAQSTPAQRTGPATASTAASVTTYADLAYGPDAPANLLDLYVPETNQKRLPLIIWTSGSAFGSNTVKGGAQAAAIVAEFTARGYAVAAMNVHTNREAKFPTQGYDARAAIRFLRAHARDYGIDPNRIAALGNSSGAWSAGFAAATSDTRKLPGETGVRTSSAVAATVLFFPPTEFLTMDSFATAQGLPMPAPFYPHDAPGSPESVLIQCPGETDDEMGIQECPAVTEAANPSSYLDGKEVPIWVLHGLEDDKVPYNQSQQVYEKTTAEGNPARFTLVPTGQHDVSTIIDAPEATTRITERRGRETVVEGAGPSWDDIDSYLRDALR